ncbi:MULTISPECIES: sugar ABC transporter permease [unclassified Actinobaculum]|uniref:carbohydrate ABC transporter permease n=1 Tax=unclassified Actinobaculum TaxID=2609299 RepID=UPI000D5290BC|nr:MULTISPECIES: sugar ABC transporter permease [unclassified Actinobaculum]AWE42489.1 ABC transporter permease [Actinobaculum sp. 313]RTE48714.1 sugar ABC transporter permease [Actinobaculum sp. 352]
MSTTQAAPAAPEEAAPLPMRRSRLHNNERRAGIGFTAPAVLLIVVFLVIPVLLSFALGFTNARMGSMENPGFTGLTNFVRALTKDPTFWDALRNIAIFVLVVVPLQGGLGLVLALLVNQKIRGITTFRVVFFMPVVTSMVVVSMLWKFMYQKDGLINAITGLNVDWLNETHTALPAVIVMSVWQGVGFQMILWLSGLQSINHDLYEAASLDGAGRWQQFRNVTMPGLRPTFVFIFITITISAFSLFTQIDVMTNGGPSNATTTLVYHIIQMGSSRGDVGYGSALSLIFFVIVLAVTLLQRFLTREED